MHYSACTSISGVDTFLEKVTEICVIINQETCDDKVLSWFHNLNRVFLQHLPSTFRQHFVIVTSWTQQQRKTLLNH